MDITRTLNCRLESVAWGAILGWLGFTMLFRFLPDGTGAFGIGLILIGLNVARSLSGIRMNGFSLSLGVIALVWGALELAGSVLSLPFRLPVLPLLLMILGAILLWRELLQVRKKEVRDSCCCPEPGAGAPPESA